MGFNSFKNKFEKISVVENNNLVSKTPLVSVCIQTYQHVDFISECLESILKQKTNFPFEIILGEDDSTDGTKLICENYANTYKNKIRLFSHRRENNIIIKGKPSGRFNMMYNIYSSKGKYIALCEGDDYWDDPLKLQKQVDLLEQNQNFIACHHWQKHAVLKDQEYIQIVSPIKDQGYYPEPSTKVDKIFSNQLRVKARTIMFRNIIDQNFFPDWFTNVAFGDVPLTFLLGKHGDFGYIDEEMAVYRQTGKGVSKAGLKDLGLAKFRVQHFKSWIEIWDYADKFYNYKYHKEATSTINSFINIIIENSSLNIKSITSLLNYNLFNRKMSIFKSFPATIWVVKCFSIKIGKKVKRKLLF